MTYKFQQLKSFLFLVSFVVIFVFAVKAQNRTMAVTFDDLPMTGRAESLAEAKEVNRDLLAKLRAAKITATGFVNEGKLFYLNEIDERTDLLDQWLEQGHDLGNHTFSHIPINSSSVEDYKIDLIKGETVTRKLLEKHGKTLRYFRHTQLRTGPTDEYRRKLSELLKQRQYSVAPVTIDSNEYLFAVRYSEAKNRSDREMQEKIVAAYLVYMEQVTKHFENISREFLGYEVPQVLLLHANALNADHFDRLATVFRKRGYRFVTLDTALEDKAYGLPEVTSRRGLSWIHRWMLAKGLEMKEEPSEPAWIRTSLYR
ncbi:MAG: polysaccharide deacetylase family protein [Pyrinomonadaceae bacterium]|nr:polysaccharide deacetylase family protein [Pyrinomonadaceae bacterium]